MENRDLLRKAREILNLTQTHMASAMGMPFRTYQALETGQNATKGYHLAAAAHVINAGKMVLEVAAIPLSPGDAHRTDRLRDILRGRFGMTTTTVILNSMLRSFYLRASDTMETFTINPNEAYFKLNDFRNWSREAAGLASEYPAPCRVYVTGPQGIEDQLLFETIDEAMPTVRTLRKADVGIRVAWPRTGNDDAIYAELAALGAVHT